VAQVQGEGITTTEAGAPGASLLGTWVSAAAIRSRSSENYFSRICSANPHPKAHNIFPFYFNQLPNPLKY
jgi:hypothetical protein